MHLSIQSRTVGYVTWIELYFSRISIIENGLNECMMTMNTNELHKLIHSLLTNTCLPWDRVSRISHMYGVVNVRIAMVFVSLCCAHMWQTRFHSNKWIHWIKQKLAMRLQSKINWNPQIFFYIFLAKINVHSFSAVSFKIIENRSKAFVFVQTRFIYSVFMLF